MTTNLLDDQITPYLTDLNRIAVPHGLDELAVRILVQPVSAPRRPNTEPAHPTATDTYSDSLEYATWEDAEWR